MKDEIASNCSHSVASPRTKRPCDWEVHSKPPQKFGNYLTTDFGKEFEKSNISCDCQCDKWKGYNRHLLNEAKIENIKKRICKAAHKIEQINAAFQVNNQSAPQLQKNEVDSKVDMKEQGDGMKMINNLAGLKCLFKIYASNSLNGKPLIFPYLDTNHYRIEEAGSNVLAQ